jgi:uncharacterized protein YcfJ
MKSSKILSFVILATAISGVSQASAQTINETRTGYVTAVETVWTQRIINEPVTTTSCHTNQAHSGFHRNMGDVVIGGLVGSAIGNKLSDRHGAGSLGALFGAVTAIDRSSDKRSVCHDQTSYRKTTEDIADHYLVHVRTEGRILTFRSNHRYRVNQRVSLSVSSNYGLLR